jgi:mycothiol synthase
MKVSRLTDDKVKEFIEYCVKYCPEQDESFIPREDYMPENDEITYLLLNDNNEIAGTASLMLNSQFRKIKKGRFRIFHCKEKLAGNYKLLLDEVLKHTNGIENIFCFITEENTDVIKIWESLGFKIRRYSWVLDRKIDDTISFKLPEGFTVKKMVDGRDEESYCNIINSAFAQIEGHTHFLPERIEEMKKDNAYFDGGFNLLWNNDEPVALIKLIKTNEDGEDILFINTLAVHTSFQGKGLGRALLKYGINLGKQMGLKRAMLTVNSENANATDLYFKNGFMKIVVYICYNKELN